MAALSIDISHGHCGGFLLSYENHEATTASDCRVDQVTLQEHKLLCGTGHNHAWKFATLGLMHGNGESRSQFIKFARIVIGSPAVVEANTD